jgi:predicted nuclease of predicted toxin-antitoxin system
MRWLADENIPRSATAMLRERGEDVRAIGEAHAGMTDRDVLNLAVAEARILLTFDRDHGDLIFNDLAEPPPGVVYLRILPASAEQVGDVLAQIMDASGEGLSGFLTVVTKDGIRQRRLPQSDD